MNQYSSVTIDIVLSGLANALGCRIILLKKIENDYCVECNDHVINPLRELFTPKFTVKLLCRRNIIIFWLRNPLFKGIYWISSKFLHYLRDA